VIVTLRREVNSVFEGKVTRGQPGKALKKVGRRKGISGGKRLSMPAWVLSAINEKIKA